MIKVIVADDEKITRESFVEVLEAYDFITMEAATGKLAFPLGRSKPIEIDVRIITATNTNIKQQVINKEFRDDLFYQLSELIINIPPLRDRTEDVAFFAHKFLFDASTELK